LSRELKVAVELLALKSRCLLLCYANEDDPVANPALLSDAVSYLILPLFVVELVNRNLFPFRQRYHGIAKFLAATCPSTTGEGIGLPNCSRMNVTKPPAVCQRAHVTIQVQPVQALHFQRHMSI
jgi:hypothetical protein